MSNTTQTTKPPGPPEYFDGYHKNPDELAEEAADRTIQKQRACRVPVLRAAPLGNTHEDYLLRLWRKKAYAELWARSAICWEEINGTD